MARTLAGSRLARLIRIGNYCESKGISTSEGLERVAAMPTRRGALGRIAGATAGVALLGATGRAHARAIKPSQSSARIAVVGAGLGGLACADALAAAGANVRVFEARDRVGGRCHSISGFLPGQTFEAGGELIDTAHSSMRAYAREFGLDLEVVEAHTLELRYHLDGVLVPEADVVDEYRALVASMKADLRTLTNGITPETFTDADALLDYMPLDAWLESRGAGDIISAAINSSYTGEYGLEIAQQSALNFLLFIHADKRSKFTPFGQFSDEKYHIIGGNQQVPNGLAARLGDRIELGMALTAARRDATGAVTLSFDGPGGAEERRFDAVVFAAPFSVLRTLDLAGLDLPAFKQRAIDELVYGTNSKLMLGTVGRPWRLDGASGSSYCTLPNVLNTWETEPTTGDDALRGVMTSFLGGARGVAVGAGTAGQQAEAFLADAEQVFPGLSAAARRDGDGDPIAYRAHWPSEPFSRGSYVCNHPGYFTTILGHEATQTGNLYWCGEHADSFYAWQGFMEGALNSGLRAASEVIADIKVGAYDD